jgi:DNA-binding XRE family transcriptional regulator
MARNFRVLYDKLPAENRERIEAWVEETLRRMPLDELRQARQFTQTSLASTLGVDQGSISKLERRTDMYLSTLRSYIEAMGGKLELRAVFPDGAVVIENLREIPAANSEALQEQ